MAPALVVVPLLAALAGAVELSAEAGGGGGYETNVDHALESEPTRGAGFAEAWASGGAHLPFGPGHELYLQLGYDGTVLPDADEYSSHRFSLALGTLLFAGDRLLFRITPSAGYRLATDSTRSGLDYGLSVALRLRVLSRLGARLSAGALRRDARDPIWSYDLARGRAGLEFDAGWAGRWSAGASLEGQAAQSGGAPLSTVFAPEELGPDVTSAWVGDVGARWSLGAHLRLELSGTLTRASTASGAWTSHVLRGGLGAVF